MLAALLANLTVPVATGGGGGPGPRRRGSRDGEKLVGLYQIPYYRRRKRVIEEIREVEAHVEALLVDAEGEQRERLERVETQLAALELQVVQVRNVNLKLILSALRAIEEELDDEHVLLLLM